LLAGGRVDEAGPDVELDGDAAWCRGEDPPVLLEGGHDVAPQPVLADGLAHGGVRADPQCDEQGVDEDDGDQWPQHQPGSGGDGLGGLGVVWVQGARLPGPSCAVGWAWPHGPGVPGRAATQIGTTP